MKKTTPMEMRRRRARRRHKPISKRVRQRLKRLRRHLYGTPGEHGAAVAELQAEYREAKKRYHALGDRLFSTKSSSR